MKTQERLHDYKMYRGASLSPWHTCMHGTAMHYHDVLLPVFSDVDLESVLLVHLHAASVLHFLACTTYNYMPLTRNMYRSSYLASIY